MKKEQTKLQETFDIPLTQGYVAKISIQDIESVNKYKWHACFQNGYTYAATYINKKQVRLHNFILNAEFVDHRNHDTLDCTRGNIRACTKQQNCFNTRKHRDAVHSKYKGVTINNGKWRARIRFNYKLIHIGYYSNELDAALAYNKKAMELFGEFAYLNQV